MSNDPNRMVQQQRDKQKPGGHGTLETYQLEKEKAQFSPRQKTAALIAGVVLALVILALIIL